MVQVDHNVTKTTGGKHRKIVRNDRLAADVEHRLWEVVGVGPETAPYSGGKNERVHSRTDLAS
jgi:hypothetical protein